MAFNPNLPASHAPIVSQELRDQLNALKTLIDAKPSMDDVNAAIAANSAANPSDITYTQMVPSDPPTQSDLQTVIDLLNNLITTLKRQA